MSSQEKPPSEKELYRAEKRRLKADFYRTSQKYIQARRWHEKPHSYLTAKARFNEERHLAGKTVYSRVSSHLAFKGALERFALARSDYYLALDKYATVLSRSSKSEYGKKYVNLHSDTIVKYGDFIAKHVIGKVAKGTIAGASRALTSDDGLLKASAWGVLGGATIVAGTSPAVAAVATPLVAGVAVGITTYATTRTIFNVAIRARFTSSKIAEYNDLEEASRAMARAKRWRNNISGLAGLGVGYSARTFAAEFFAKTFGYNTYDTLRDTLLDWAEEERGVETFLPTPGSGEIPVLVATENLTVAEAHRRLHEFATVKDTLLNTSDNSTIFARGTQLSQRLDLLLSAQERLGELLNKSGNHEGTIALLEELKGQIPGQEALVKEWMSEFDVATDAARAVREVRASKGLAELVAGIVDAEPASPPEHPPGVPIVETSPRALPLEHGALTPENFTQSMSAVTAEITHLENVMREYDRVISPNDDMSKNLHALHDQQGAAMARAFKLLQPIFEDLPAYYASIGDRVVADQYTTDVLKTADINSFSRVVDTSERAAHLLASIGNGEVWVAGLGELGGEAVAIEHVVRFKVGAGTQLPPQLGAIVARLNHDLILALGSDTMRVNEGWPLSRLHYSLEQKNAMGADISFAPRLDGSSPPQTPEQIAAALYVGNRGTATVVLEVLSDRREEDLIPLVAAELVSRFGMSEEAAQAFAAKNIIVPKKGWISGEHFSLTDTSIFPYITNLGDLLRVPLVDPLVVPIPTS